MLSKRGDRVSYRVLNKIAGTVVGGITGASVGIIESGKISFSERGNYAAPLIFLLSAPFFSIYHSIVGSYTGGKNGFKSGINYFNTVSNKRNANEILDHMLNFSDWHREIPLLDKIEEEILKDKFNKMVVDTEHKKIKKQQLESAFLDYSTFTQTLKKYKTPIFIAVNNHVAILEYMRFREYVWKCGREGRPVCLGKSVITKTNISHDYPVFIKEFLRSAHKMIDKVYKSQGEERNRAMIMKKLNLSTIDLDLHVTNEVPTSSRLLNIVGQEDKYKPSLTMRK